MNQIDLNNKIAVITGAAQGFGYAIAKRFSASGCKVIPIDKDGAELNSAIKNEDIKSNVVDYFTTDITDFELVNKTINSIFDKHGSIDIFVNNAGIAGPSYKTWEYPNDDWNLVVDIDLNGTFNCCKVLLPYNN